MNVVIYFFQVVYFIDLIGLIHRFSNWDEIIHLTMSEILLFCSTLCAPDAVAALAIVSSEKYPKIFSIIFGECKNNYKL